MGKMSSSFLRENDPNRGCALLCAGSTMLPNYTESVLIQPSDSIVVSELMALLGIQTKAELIPTIKAIVAERDEYKCCYLALAGDL